MKFWDEVFSLVKQTQPVYLASIEGNEPRVRPVTLIFFNDEFWVATGSNDAKVNQIRDNENIEFCLPLKGEKSTGYIRGSGRAEIVDSLAARKMIFENIGFIKYHWSEPTDPDYILLKIILTEIE
jgi:uncharacterized pyridoxamine 5'-phosphate oxidase family protein